MCKSSPVSGKLIVSAKNSNLHLFRVDSYPETLNPTWSNDVPHQKVFEARHGIPSYCRNLEGFESSD